MHISHTTLLSALTALSALVPQAAAGINCKGSALCPRAGFLNKAPSSVMEVMNDLISHANVDNATTFENGEHITCIKQGTEVGLSVGVGGSKGPNARLSFGSGSIKSGGICLFPQKLKGPVPFKEIRELVPALIRHKCSTCGSIPLRFTQKPADKPDKRDEHLSKRADPWNSDEDGFLTFNYVKDPICIDKCIDPVKAQPMNANPSSSATGTQPKQSNTASGTSDSGASATDSAPSATGQPTYVFQITNNQAPVNNGPVNNGPINNNQGPVYNNNGSVENNGPVNNNDGPAANNIDVGPVNNNEGPVNNNNNDGTVNENYGSINNNEGPVNSNSGPVNNYDGPIVNARPTINNNQRPNIHPTLHNNVRPIVNPTVNNNGQPKENAATNTVSDNSLPSGEPPSGIPVVSAPQSSAVLGPCPPGMARPEPPISAAANDPPFNPCTSTSSLGGPAPSAAAGNAFSNDPPPMNAVVTANPTGSGPNPIGATTASVPGASGMPDSARNGQPMGDSNVEPAPGPSAAPGQLKKRAMNWSG